MIKAVVVGINVFKNFPDQTLAGCINDAEDVLAYLTERLGVTPSDITPLFDERATKAAVVQAVRDMIASSSPGDHLLLHFSGHGAQIASSDVAEPDGLDEVLCPTDFDFDDRSSALTDKEIAALIATLPASVAWTLVADACHSGDLVRDLSAKPPIKPRFLRPPPDVAWRLRKRHAVARPRALTQGNGVVVSACASSENAADISFDQRANGAFTYNWLRALAATPQASLDALVTDVAKALDAFKMHPEVAGPAALRASAFLAAPPASRSLSDRAPLARKRTLPVAGRAIVLFEKQWSGSVMGLPVSLDLRITRDGADFDFEFAPGVAGSKFSVDATVDGNVSIPISVPLVGQVIVDIGGWDLSETQLDFDIAVRIVPPAIAFMPPLTIAREHLSIVVPFLGPIEVTNQHLTLPLTATRAIPVSPQSPADLYAMLQLAQLSGSDSSASGPRSPAAPSAWRSRDAHGPALLRVELGPCDDQGRVYVNGESMAECYGEQRVVRIRELPDGDYNIRFELGNQGGWRYESNCSIFVNDEFVGNAHDVGGTGFDAPTNVDRARREWNVRIRDGQLLPDRDLVAAPMPRPAPAPAPSRPRQNGHKPSARARLAEVLLRLMDEDPFEMPGPEAGGSIRA